LIGREREIETVRDLLRHSGARAGSRLVTITGPGGVGKTRLAVELATTLATSFADGVAFVQLASLTDPALVLPTIAWAVGIRDSGGRSAGEALAAELHDQELLLVCDNFESVVDAGLDLASLLRRCPRLRVLATSRISLHVSGERVIAIAPLPTPDPARVPALDELAASESVRFFVDRAVAAHPDFALTAANAAAVAAICHHLDGLPLALELAAARTKVLSPSALFSRLSRRLDFLTGGPRDLPARQQTMRTTIAWSYDLLTPEEQRLFRLLAVFSGGFDLEAVEHLAGGQGDRGAGGQDKGVLLSPCPLVPLSPSVLDGIASLIEKSVVQEEGGTDDDQLGIPRYSMLETIREYGMEWLTGHGEEAGARQRHAAWFLALAEEAMPYLTSVERGRWLDRLEADHANLRAAMSWSIANESAEKGQRFVAALWRFWETNGHVTEGRAWVERALAREDQTPSAARAGALTAASILAHRQGDYPRSIAYGDESLAIWRPLGDSAGVAFALNVFGNIAIDTGDYPRALALHQEALALRRELGDAPAIGTSLNNLGVTAREMGDYDRAWAIHQEQLALERARNDPVDVAFALTGLANVAHRRGDLRQSAALHSEALALRRQVDPRGYAVAGTLSDLGTVYADLGKSGQAIELLLESLSLRVRHDEKLGIAHSIEGLAGLAAALGQPDLAVRLLGAAESLRTSMGTSPTTFERARTDGALAAAARVIGATAVGTELVAGRSLSLDQIVAETTRLRSVPPLVTPATDEDAASPDTGMGLSPRELDVLKLLAEGRSNREIGDALSISHRTVMVHVTNILAKFGVNSRTAAVAHAHRHGLVSS
jgi:non-specific serine/threonine protein kinase